MSDTLSIAKLSFLINMMNYDYHRLILWRKGVIAALPVASGLYHNFFIQDAEQLKQN